MQANKGTKRAFAGNSPAGATMRSVGPDGRASTRLRPVHEVATDSSGDEGYEDAFDDGLRDGAPLSSRSGDGGSRDGGGVPSTAAGSEPWRAPPCASTGSSAAAMPEAGGHAACACTPRTEPRPAPTLPRTTPGYLALLAPARAGALLPRGEARADGAALHQARALLALHRGLQACTRIHCDFDLARRLAGAVVAWRERLFGRVRAGALFEAAKTGDEAQARASMCPIPRAGGRGARGGARGANCSGDTDQVRGGAAGPGSGGRGAVGWAAAWQRARRRWRCRRRPAHSAAGHTAPTSARPPR